MQNRECNVFERTRDTEQRIYEPGECLWVPPGVADHVYYAFSRHVDKRYFQSKDTCSFSEFTDWTAYVWEPAILEIPSKPNGIFKAFDEVPPGFLHELKIPIQTVFFASYYPVVVEGKGGGGGGW